MITIMLAYMTPAYRAYLNYSKFTHCFTSNKQKLKARQ